MAEASGEGTAPHTPPADREPTATEQQLDLGLKVLGAFVATGLGALAGLYEALLVPLRLPHGPYLPVSLVLAILGNPALSWFASGTTGRRSAAILPAAAWCVIWYAAATRTTEGDLIITGGNWVGMVTLLAGPIAFAVGVFVPIMREQRRALRAPGAGGSADAKPADRGLRGKPSRG